MTKGTPLTFQYLPEYSGRISWVGNVNVSPKEAVFILSNVSQSDSRQYGCRINRDGLGTTRVVDLIVTGKTCVEFDIFVFFLFLRTLYKIVKLKAMIYTFFRLQI